MLLPLLLAWEMISIAYLLEVSSSAQGTNDISVNTLAHANSFLLHEFQSFHNKLEILENTNWVLVKTNVLNFKLL